MTQCQKPDTEIERAILDFRHKPREQPEPGRCMFCAGKLPHAFSVMADGEVERVSEGHEYYAALIQRWTQAKAEGRSMTTKPGAIVIPLHACDRSIKLMDKVDAEVLRRQIEREKTKSGDKGESRESWTSRYDK
jgi:hypothetical protein